MIDIEKIKSYLSHCPESGVFLWKKKRKGVTLGSVVGRKVHNCIKICFDGVEYRAHHLAIAFGSGSFPVGVVDHIDGNPFNNSLSNLRVVTQRENMMNRKIPSNNAHGLMGVYWHSQNSNWFAAIKSKGELIHLGSFSCFFDACCARKSAERKLGFHMNHGRA